jgi:hypothetical protein
VDLSQPVEKIGVLVKSILYMVRIEEISVDQMLPLKLFYSFGKRIMHGLWDTLVPLFK